MTSSGGHYACNHRPTITPPPPGRPAPNGVTTVFVIWRSRPVIGRGPGPFLLGDPMCRDADCARYWWGMRCEHRGPGRLAWTPLVMHSERREGGPRQRALLRLPTIRTCCIADRLNRAAWWHDVNYTLRGLPGWAEGPLNDALLRDRPAMLARLREVVPRPTPRGRAELAAFLEARRAVAEAQHEQDDRGFRERAAEGDPRFRAVSMDDPFGAAARRDAGEARGINADLATLGLSPDAGPEEVGARFRELARRHHPDRGGEVADFICIQHAYERCVEAPGRERDRPA